MNKTSDISSVDENTQLDSTGAQLLVEIYESVDISMDLQHIFSAILSKILPAVNAESGIVQINSADTCENFYGFSPETGIEFWEYNERYPCPEFIQKAITAVSGLSSEQKHKSFCLASDIFYAPIRDVDLRKSGYVAVTFQQGKEQADQLALLMAAVNQIAIILEKKRGLEEKRDAQKKSLLKSILATLSHDMKTPLSGISGFVQLIEHKTDDDSIKKYCETILGSLSQLEDINSEFLFLIDKNSLKFKKSNISLDTCIQKVCEKLEKMYSYEGVEIVLNAKSALLVEADEESFIKVLKNILRNAKEAQPDGGKITITLSKNRNQAVIEIADTGKGVPFPHKDKIFGPFNTFGKESAPGLGLTFAKRFIEEHGGSISFTSMIGKGTVFTIHLPLVKKEE